MSVQVSVSFTDDLVDSTIGAPWVTMNTDTSHLGQVLVHKCETRFVVGLIRPYRLCQSGPRMFLVWSMCNARNRRPETQIQRGRLSKNQRASATQSKQSRI